MSRREVRRKVVREGVSGGRWKGGMRRERVGLDFLGGGVVGGLLRGDMVVGGGDGGRCG